ncbi:CRISPR-associated endonuclease Cas2 [Candidatus Cetobacterium colombiensis]|uniref:CRISPR-associated endoribonuclease Cas2 n=1 Tax=Candidatus Cetobacterium colombiensis TaxID=3073100 RepID=A0ABU4WCP1_9FUSO|nr:CRISPR-associated endonuclease Cas2 [Candidatus Cetobacterium colombiensis]MDX8337288.1 CRISPR-associated endonuclease Cas2 [Candidatus Cetobacterium colombiensis]
MIYIVSYDISNNNNRVGLNKFLKESGLLPIQKSVFFGELSPKGKETLIKESKNFFNNKKDSLLFISLCSDDFLSFKRVGVNKDLNKLKKQEVDFL